MGKSKGWNPQQSNGHFKCLDCGHTIVANLTDCKIMDLQHMMIGHNDACVPGKDKAPTGPIGLAFGMSIQLRDLFVMAQLGCTPGIYDESDARGMYHNADILLAERDKQK
jgi:hypothetical protein